MTTPYFQIYNDYGVADGSHHHYDYYRCGGPHDESDVALYSVPYRWPTSVLSAEFIPFHNRSVPLTEFRTVS